MPTIEFPRRRLAALQDLASRILERHKGDDDALARELLSAFYEVCMQSGLDRVLVELEQAHAPLESSQLAHDPTLRVALAARLGNKAEFDPGGPRNAKPRQLADCVVATLSLTVVDEPARTITLADTVRAQVTAAIAGVIEIELAPPQIRTAIIATAREACESRFHSAFDKLVPHLDPRGVRFEKQPKIPLDAVQAVQRVLADARTALFTRAANAAVDRVKDVLARVNEEAATRIDAPVTLRLTPRDVAVRRVVGLASSPVAMMMHGVFEGLSDLAQLAWSAAEQAVRPYAASQTFAVGDVLEHPKFGRGKVVSAETQRISVEFAEATHTLVHARK